MSENMCKLFNRAVCTCKSLSEMKNCTFHKDSGISQMCCDFKTKDGCCKNVTAVADLRLSEADLFLSKLGNGGTIVSTGDCSDEQIALAQSCDRFYAASNMLGFIYFPNVVSGPVKFRAIRTDQPRHVTGNYFVAPLTDENSGCDSKDGLFFLCGPERHCIQEDGGVVFTIKPETLEIFIHGVWVLLSQLTNATSFAKRKPLPDGTLPLTDEELEEFNRLFYPSIVSISKIGIERTMIKICFGIMYEYIDSYKAIAYLLERFDLRGDPC